MTAKFREVVANGVAMAGRTGRVRQAEKFLWSPQMHTPPLRSRMAADPKSRQMVFVAPEEIALAVRQVVAAAYGIPKDSAARSVCRVFGFDRVTEEMKYRVEEVVNGMIARGELIINNELLTIL